MGNTATKVAVGVFFGAPIVVGALAEFFAAPVVSTPAPPSTGVGAVAGTAAVAGKTSAASSSIPETPSPCPGAFEAAKKTAREAAEAVFEAIAQAAKTASVYMTSLYNAVASAAVTTNDAVKRFAAKAYDSVKRAAASVSCLVVVLIECLHGVSAALWAKAKLDGVDGLLRDVPSFVASLLRGIQRASAPAFPDKSFGYLVLPESPTAKRAKSSAADMSGLHDLIYMVEKMLGFKIPTVAITLIRVAVDLALELCFPTEGR